MNKKQLMVVWVIGIYLTVFLSLFALKYYEEYNFPVNLKFQNGHIYIQEGLIFFDDLIPESKRAYGSVNVLLMRTYAGLHQIVYWMIIISPMILIIGGLLIYTLRNKKK